MRTFVCWKWKSPSYRTVFTAEHANVWNASLRRHYDGDIRTICITDDPKGVEFETFPLWKDCSRLQNPSGPHLPSCYRRLRIFSSFATGEMDIDEGSEVVSLDLDVVVVRDIKTMLDMYPESDFVGWRGVGSYNPVVYNGTLFRFRTGAMDWLWDDFDPEKSPMAANRARYFGSDQGYLSWRLNGTKPGWGALDGILSFTSDMRAYRALLPEFARIVSFNGKKNPWDADTMANAPWVRKHWRL